MHLGHEKTTKTSPDSLVCFGVEQKACEQNISDGETSLKQVYQATLHNEKKLNAILTTQKTTTPL